MKDVELRVDFHAYTQYRERVQPIRLDVLERHLQARLAAGEYHIRKKRFLVIDEVWWVYFLTGKKLVIVTCYGKTSMDLIRGLKWANRYHDQIDLKNMISVQGGEVTCSEADREAEEVCRRVSD